MSALSSNTEYGVIYCQMQSNFWASLIGLKLFYYRRSKEGQHDFMVASERKSFTAPLGGSLYDISVWPVMLDKVHIDRGKVLQWTAEVPNQGHCFKEYFRE